MLKPVSSKELIGVLLRVNVQIDEEMLKKEDMETLKGYYVKSLTVLKEKFLTYLITNKLNKDEIQEKCKNYNINLKGNRFVVSVINIDYKLIHQVLKTDNSNKTDLIKFAVLNIMEEIINQHGRGTVFIYNNPIVLISPFLEDDREVIFSKIQSTLEAIRQSIEKSLLQLVLEQL